MAGVSNWGAYGIAAALADLLDDENVLHDEATELRMFDRCVAAGAMDCAYARQIPFVDGTSAGVQSGLITLLRQIVANRRRSHARGF